MTSFQTHHYPACPPAPALFVPPSLTHTLHANRKTSSFTSPPSFSPRRRQRHTPYRAIPRSCLPSSTSTTPSVGQPQTVEPPPDDAKTFSDAYAGRVPDWLLLRLTELGFTHPVPIQQHALAHALPALDEDLGGDVVIHAQTGSGKTLAYLLPAIAAVSPQRACVQALIVVPTQELGMQVYKLLRRLTSRYRSLARAAEGMADDTGALPTDDDDELLDSTELELLGESPGESGDGTSAPPEVQAADRMVFPVLPMLNQADLRRQKLQLREAAPRIIVGNPHRIAELVDSGRLRLDLLKLLVVDEFDACLLDTSTTAALQTVLSVRNREGARQTILASATVPQHRHFLRQCVRQHWTRPDIAHVWLEEAAGVPRVPPNLAHFYALCDARKKVAALRALLLRFNEGGDDEFALRAIVFVMPSRDVGAIVNALNSSIERAFGIEGARPIVGMRNELGIGQRREALQRFRKGEAKVLVSTDVAARGLDVPDVSTVLHFDLPTDGDAYLHRAGRAGRLGRDGRSVVMITRGEEFVVSRISNKLEIDFERVSQKTAVAAQK